MIRCGSLQVSGNIHTCSELLNGLRNARYLSFKTRFQIFLTAEKIRYDFAYFLHTGFQLATRRMAYAEHDAFGGPISERDRI